MKSYRILLCALGSLGDLHPFLALGQQLQARGHAVKVASLERYQHIICELGFDFAPIRAFVDMEDKAELKRIMHLRKGSEYLIKDVVFKHAHEVYADILAATDDVALMLTGEIFYAAQLAVEVKGLPWGTLRPLVSALPTRWPLVRRLNYEILLSEAMGIFRFLDPKVWWGCTERHGLETQPIEVSVD